MSRAIILIPRALFLKISRSTLSTSSVSRLEFEAIPGLKPCYDENEEHETNSASETKNNQNGPEPNYQSLNPNSYNVYKHQDRFLFRNGGVLPEVEVAYETWGKLNESKSNAVLLFTGLSANSHAKSNQRNPNPGWWEDFIGDKLAIDTDKFFVICCNHLGSCFGTTGPSSINPITKKHYASTFPILTVHDMIKIQFHLLDHLNIHKLHAAIGSSLGGMCSILSGLNYSPRVSKIIAISSCARADPSSIAMRYLQRKAIMLDPNWNQGFYYNKSYPKNGIKLAREIATVTYRSGPEWNIRFGRKYINEKDLISLNPCFEIENYLAYQGEKFSTKYDPNSLLYLSKAMDLYDIADGFSSLETAASNIRCPVLIMGAKTDILFPVKQQIDLSKMLKDSGNNAVTFFEMESLYGHDTFLLNLNDVGTAIKGFLETNMIRTGNLSKSSTNMK